MPLRDAALLLLGHGSTLNADSSVPTYQHAEEIRHRNIFAEVHVGFWKEEPNFRQALRQARQRRVFVVPNFISSGYFTEQIIPRELGLTGPITPIGKQEVFYCDPIGLHPSMTDVLLHRAYGVVAQSQEEITAPERSACLFICGHGTSMNDNSTKIIHEQAAAIRAKGIYADCQPVLMEQRPFVKDWRALTDCSDVIVVPFFISDGLHSFEDIPVLLGMPPDVRKIGFTNPHRENGRRLWYATAIGTEPEIADVIVEQAEHYAADPEGAANGTDPEEDDATEQFAALFSSETKFVKIGQVLIQRRNTGGYELRHADHENLPDPLYPSKSKIVKIRSFAELREWLRLDDSSKFRPLRAAPNLRNGWFMTAGRTEIGPVLDYFYPAEIANWSLWKSGKLPITPWQETAERQTGRFRVVRELDKAGVKELAAQVCDRGCLKRRLWSPCVQPVEEKPHEIPLLCPEACNYLVSKAREKLKGADEEDE